MKWRKFLRRKKKKRRKKRNSLAETASKDSSWRRPYCLIQTLGFLLWVTNNGVEEETLIIKTFSKESAIIVRGISSFRAKCKFLPIFQIKKFQKNKKSKQMANIFVLVQLWRLRFQPWIREEIMMGQSVMTCSNNLSSSSCIKESSLAYLIVIHGVDVGSFTPNSKTGYRILPARMTHVLVIRPPKSKVSASRSSSAENCSKVENDGIVTGGRY